MSENIFAMRGNIIDITLGIIAYAISIRVSWAGTIAVCEKNVHLIFI